MFFHLKGEKILNINWKFMFKLEVYVRYQQSTVVRDWNILLNPPALVFNLF